MDLHGFLYSVSYWAIPALFAITLREVAHGWVARLCGDGAAALRGRLHFNPLRHIDPVGTVVVPALLLALELPIFGWAKSVPVSFADSPHPRRAAVLAALAGPAANILMALFWCIVLGTIVRIFHGGTIERWILLMAYAGILSNVALAIVHVLPIPPLDGWRVLSVFLPARWTVSLEKFAPAGIVIVVGLSVFNMLGWLLIPTYSAAGQVISALTTRPAT